MPMTVTIQVDKLKEFKEALPETGCSLSGKSRWSGKSTYGRIKTFEIKLPHHWEGSMTETIYSLPGVVSYGGQMFGRGFLSFLAKLHYWYLSPSSLW